MNYERKYQTLNKAVTCVQWTEDEQRRLVELQRQFGSNWSLLSSSYFPNRNPNQLKCKFNYLINKKKTANDKLLKYFDKQMNIPSFSETKKQTSQTESHSHIQEEAVASMIQPEPMMSEYDMLFDMMYDFE